MFNLDQPQQNLLLGALPADQYAFLFSHLELVQMLTGEVLYESGEETALRLFPHDRHRIQVLRFGKWRFNRNRCQSATKA